MNPPRADALAVRVVNQYRRRDFLAYLGLRYYLACHCATHKAWAREIAPRLVLARPKPAYFRVFHYKEHRDGPTVEHRDIVLPGPNEALAESALLDECSRHAESFNPLPCVFSYRLATDGYKGGIFQPYFPGFRARHRAVAQACRMNCADTVHYTDIKRFYPSVSRTLAQRAWTQACEAAKLEGRFRSLGEKMLDDHAEQAKQAAASAPETGIPATHSPGLLTGPMLSHLVANLILRDVDARMRELIPGGYLRYVDDIILVGSCSRVTQAESRLSSLLADLGLHLHESAKGFRVPTAEWLEGGDDLEDEGRKPSWRSFVGDLKQFLLAKPEQRDGAHGNRPTRAQKE